LDPRLVAVVAPSGIEARCPSLSAPMAQSLAAARWCAGRFAPALHGVPMQCASRAAALLLRDALE
jgi:hypothetical protein